MLRLCVRTGMGHKPALDLSFQQHDFGACLVKQPGIQAIQKTLRLKNNDTSDISFDIECVAQAFLPCHTAVPSSAPCMSNPSLYACKEEHKVNRGIMPLAAAVQKHGMGWHGMFCKQLSMQLVLHSVHL